jgi:TP901 family phage tail tape measure protein
MEGIVLASVASGDSLIEVGDIIAKTTRTFNLSATQSGYVADLLAQTANSTNSSITGLGESLKYIGPAAYAANQPLDDLMVLLGLLGDSGIQGSQAGTNLAAALDGLKIASAGVDTEFTGLVRGSAGRTKAFEAIAAEVRNADGSMKSLLDVLPAIQQNLGSMSRQDQDIPNQGAVWR